MNETIRRITGPDAISLPAAITLAAIMFFSNLSSSGIVSDSYFWEISLAWALSLIGAFGWLWFARHLMRRNGNPDPLVWQTFAAFAVAFVLRAVIFDGVAFWSGASGSPELLYRLTASIPTFGVGLLICAYIVSLARKFSRNMGHLTALNTEREELNNTAKERVAGHRVELISYIQSSLRRELDIAMETEPETAIERLRGAIEQVVRPVSRQLVVSMPDVDLPSPPRGRHIAWSSVLRNVLSANPLRPLWFALWVAGAAWAISIARHEFLETFIFVGLVFITAWASMSLFSLGWRKVETLPGPLRIGYISIAGVVVGLVVNLAVGRYSPVASTQSQMVFAYAFISLGIVWFIALVTSLRRMTHTSTLSVCTSECELRDALVLVNTRLREQRLAISRVLHGPVQDRILAAVFKLVNVHSANSTDEDLVDELVFSIEKEIDKMSLIELKPAQVRLALTELSELWAGVVEIHCQLEDSVSTTLDRYPASAYTVIEIVREACSNAIRHGEASNIYISIYPGVRINTMQLVVKNDGQPLAEVKSMGVGSFLLDELTLEWNRTTQEDTTTLSALVPLVS